MYLTASLPGTGGSIKASPEDFLVEEIPAYPPAGGGAHTFLFIEKRGLNTREAIAALCRHLAVREADAGAAGLKDRQAVTRQWVSLPGVAPEAAAGLSLEARGGSVTVLTAARHPHKLRTGHLHGNRFTVTVRGTTCGLDRARAITAALVHGGLPNRYGSQRLGPGDRNAAEGRRLLLGELRVRDRFRRRLLISAWQAALFNRYLDERQADDLLRTALVGDILKKGDTGGLFQVTAEALAGAQERLARGEVVVTGPMFGSRMMAPAEGTAAAVREARLLIAEGVRPEHLAALGPLGEGTRRPLLCWVMPPEEGELVSAHPEDLQAIILRFALPKGAYATVLLEEVMKTDAVPDLDDAVSVSI
jgi:tRNA pseudouridine13 synthase